MNNPPNALAPYTNPFLRSSKLTEVQRAKLASHIFTRFGLRACEFCGTSSWAIGEHLVTPLPLSMDHFARNYRVETKVVHASVHLVCMNCGNTKLFHLAQLQWDPFLPENQ
jgi:hypothetical protein